MPDFTTFSVLFFVRKHSRDNQKSSIYARITTDGKRSELSLKRSVAVNHWDPSMGRGTTPAIRSLNQYLDHTYIKLLDCHKQLSSENRVLSAQNIKARYLGNDAQDETLIQCIAYQNKSMVTILKPGTLKNYFTTEKYLKEFLQKRFGPYDIFLSELNYRFITDFEVFIRTYKPEEERKTCTNNDTLKHLERLKKVVILAVKLEWLSKNPFQNYQLKFKKADRQYLNEYELERLQNTSFTRQSLERVKDSFLFSCFSGLSYIDIKKLTSYFI